MSAKDQKPRPSVRGVVKQRKSPKIMKIFLQKTISIATVSLFFFSIEVAAEDRNLIGSCSWVPGKTHSVNELQSPKKIELSNSLPEREKDYLQVSEKGRVYFHALPNELCKSNIFIIKGDTVQIIDSYPVGDLSFNNSYARVIFYSKIMKGNVIGWVKMSSLRRLTDSEIRN